MLNSKFNWKYNQYENFTFDEGSKYNEFIQKLLFGREIIGAENINKFMNPRVSDFYDPFLLCDMKKVVERIMDAKRNDEFVVVYGDYDVDGITSTSILYKFLKSLNINVEYYIPNRMEEGHGINKNALTFLKNKGVDLVITVDTGIAAINEVEYANSIGLEIIITDHHECQHDIPDAFAVVNPKRNDCSYPFKSLAGVGVTFKLIHAIAIENNIVDEIWQLLDIVAIGTIADIVSLSDENRVIAKFGFDQIKNTKNVGLAALLDQVGYKGQDITAGFIGFVIGPRLNAAGRIDDATKCVDLFVTEDVSIAKKIAKELDDNNKNRQSIEQQILEEVMQEIENDNKLKDKKIIVLCKENWHHGVIGIVASKVVDRYYKPVIILNLEDGIAKGSARSISGFNIFSAMENSKDLLDKFGGHEMAAGMSISYDKFEVFKKHIEDYAYINITEDMLKPKLKIECKLDTKEITTDFIKEIEKLEPYGMGNAEPNFSISGELEDIKLLGKESTHLKLKVKENNAIIDGIMFGGANYFEYLSKNMKVNIAGTLQNNEWNNNITPQLFIKDIIRNNEIYEKKYLEFNKSKCLDDCCTVAIRNNLHTIVEEFIVLRDDIASVYKYFRSAKNNSEIKVEKLMNDLNLNLFKLFVIFDILNEEKLAEIEIINYVVKFKLLESEKINLEQSNTLKKLKLWLGDGN